MREAHALNVRDQLSGQFAEVQHAAIGVALGDLQCAGLWRSRASLAGPMTAL